MILNSKKFRKLLNIVMPCICPAPLLYTGAAVVFQEVPDEIALAISISGCTRNCEGCHSAHLREYKGRDMLYDLEYLIDSHPGITCVCFMGGDQNLRELKMATKIIRHKFPDLKICLYTGEDDLEKVARYICALSPDYIKWGSYMKWRGGLDSSTTNQRFINIVYPYGYDNVDYSIYHGMNHYFQKNLDAEIEGDNG